MLGVGRRGPLGRWDIAEPGGGAAAVRTDDPDAEERDAWTVLAGVTGVGPVSFARLVAAFGSGEEILRAARRPGAAARMVAASRTADGGVPALAPSAATAIVDAARNPDAFLEPVRRSGLRVLTLADEAYPRRLRSVDMPPPVLFLRGDPAAMDRARAIAIVGTRRPTNLGRATAGRIADAVGSLGATIVSGLALGIDAAAHAAAVRTGTPTVAVIGGGHERLYPAAHRGLARAIVEGGGVVVSEFSPHTVPTRGTFPRRNRIISGLADATVVVEAGIRSGALTTAAWALEQGRGLYIVPGRLDDPAVAGSLAFLREAGPEARVVAGVPELLMDLGLIPASGVAPSAAGPGSSTLRGRDAPGDAPAPTLDAVLAMLGPVERVVAREVAAGRGSVDELVAATGGPGAMVLGALTSLEVRGLVLETFGRYRAAGPLAPWRVPRPRRAARERAA
jgi:DNA processing protein